MAVHGRRQVQSPEQGPEDGEVAQDFHSQQARLGRIHPAKLLTATIPDNHPKHERTACLKAIDNAILSLGAAAVDPLGKWVSDLGQPAHQRETAVFLLKQLDSPAVVPILLVALNDPAADVRRSAIRAVADRRVTEAIPTLLRQLCDTTFGLLAASALCAIGDSSTLPPVLEAFDAALTAGADRGSSAESFLVEIVGSFNHPSAVPAIIRFLQRDSGWREAEVGGTALGRSATADSIRPIREFLLAELSHRWNCEVIKECCLILGRLGDPKAVGVWIGLIAHLEIEVSRASPVRRVAADALRMMLQLHAAAVEEDDLQAIAAMAPPFVEEWYDGPEDHGPMRRLVPLDLDDVHRLAKVELDRRGGSRLNI